MAVSEKDWWDKADIVTKMVGTIIIPIAVVWVTTTWKAEKETAASSAAYVNLAKIIATTTKTRDRDGDGVYESGNALDNWVARTLANPTSPPALDGPALEDLEYRVETGALLMPSTEDFVESVIDPFLERRSRGELDPARRDKILDDYFEQQQFEPYQPPAGDKTDVQEIREHGWPGRHAACVWRGCGNGFSR